MSIQFQQILTYFASVVLILISVFVLFWFIEFRRDREYRRLKDAKEMDLAERRLEIEGNRGSLEWTLNERNRRAEEAHRIATDAGGGSGGYIVVDLAEKDRALFHDLLKGFEDYAKLKGYELSFSIDSSFSGKIAFKFTVKDSGIVVGPERVRQDFREYLEQVNNGDLSRLDNLPVIVTLDEHNLLVTLLKNRISFLQHSYQLSQNAVKYYEGLLSSIPRFPALPAAPVIVQTGGHMDSRNYNATNSSRLIQGDSNSYEDASINIGGSFNERQERVAQLDDVLSRLRSLEDKDGIVARAVKGLNNAKDEITEHAQPDKSAVKRWLEYARDALKVAGLGADVNTAVQKLFVLFGM